MGTYLEEAYEKRAMTKEQIIWSLEQLSAELEEALPLTGDDREYYRLSEISEELAHLSRMVQKL